MTKSRNAKILMFVLMLIVSFVVLASVSLKANAEPTTPATEAVINEVPLKTNFFESEQGKIFLVPIICVIVGLLVVIIKTIVERVNRKKDKMRQFMSRKYLP